MSDSALLRAIHSRLSEAGYTDLSTPLKVAGVEFPFTGAMRGREGRALDLILLVDTTTGSFGDRDGVRVQQRIEALSRALDVTGSRYVLTVILAGAMLAEGIEALSETCRVLQVESITLDTEGTPIDRSMARYLDDRIRILLPLTLPIPLSESQNSSGPAIEQLIRALPASMNKGLVDAVIAASSAGEQAVSDAVAVVINRALHLPPGVEQ